MKVLLITFIDYKVLTSGSSVRPHMMCKAFEELGYEVKLLEGQQNKRKERKKRVKEIIRWLDFNRPDFCYIEPPTGPFFNRIDHLVIKKLFRMGVPIGLFYRDAHWRFPNLFPQLWWKQIILSAMHRHDLRLFEKYCDYIYFPSASFGQIFADYKFKNTKILPPGGGNQPYFTNNFSKTHFLYAGGTSESYGGLKLLEVFEKLNLHANKYRLTFISNSKEGIDNKFYHYPWLKIVHSFDRELIAELYSDIMYAIIPFEKTEYMDLALPIKLYEYLGFGVPVISTNCDEITNLLLNTDTGIICETDVEAIKVAIEKSTKSESEYLKHKRNAMLFAKKNRWLDRALEVTSDLKGIKR